MELSQSQRLMSKFPGRVPVIIVPHGDISLQNTKYLVDGNQNISGLLKQLRTQVSVKSFEGVFLFINNTLVPNTTTLNRAYNEHHSKDGILYIHIRKEATFG